MATPVSEFCEATGITEPQFCGKEVVHGTLNLERFTTIPDGFNPTVSGSLNLSSLTQLPKGCNPTVGGSLNLHRITTIAEEFTPIVGGYLYLPLLTSILNRFDPIVGGFLDVPSLTAVPEGFNLVVGVSLILSRLSVIPKDFAPTVGHYIDMRALAQVEDGSNGCNPAAGSLLWWKNTHAESVRKPATPLTWQNGKYILADNILTEVVSQKGGVWRVKKIGAADVTYLVTDGGQKFARGDTLEEARNSLVFKLADRDVSKYKGMARSTILSFSDAVCMYRTVTGACEAGVRDFITKNNILPRDYTLAEILEKTQGAYGYETLVKFVG